MPTTTPHWTDALPTDLRAATRDVLEVLRALKMPAAAKKAAKKTARGRATDEAIRLSREAAEAAKSLYTRTQRQARTTLTNGTAHGVSSFAWQGAMFGDPDFRRGWAVVNWAYHQSDAYKTWKKRYNKRYKRLNKAKVWAQASAYDALEESYGALVGAIAAPSMFSLEDQGRMTTTMERALRAYNEARLEASRVSGHYWCRTCEAPRVVRGASTCPTCWRGVDAWEIETWVRRANAEAKARLQDRTARCIHDDLREDDPLWAAIEDGLAVYEDTMNDRDGAAFRAARAAAAQCRRNDPDNPERRAKAAQKAELIAWFEACDAANAAGEDPPPMPEVTHPDGYVEIMPNGRPAEWRDGRRVALVPLSNDYLHAMAVLDADRKRRDVELEEDLRRRQEGEEVPFEPVEEEPEVEVAEPEVATSTSTAEAETEEREARYAARREAERNRCEAQREEERARYLSSQRSSTARAALVARALRAEALALTDEERIRRDEELAEDRRRFADGTALSPIEKARRAVLGAPPVGADK